MPSGSSENYIKYKGMRLLILNSSKAGNKKETARTFDLFSDLIGLAQAENQWNKGNMSRCCDLLTGVFLNAQ